MILLLAACFLLLRLLPLLAAHVLRLSGAARRDDSAPLWLVTALYLLDLPYLLFLAVDLDYLSPEVRSSPWIGNVESVLTAFVVISSAGFLVLAAGIYSPLATRIGRSVPQLRSDRFTPARCRRAILVAGILGVAAYAYFVSRIGGLGNLWLTLYNRTLITAGTGYISYLYSLLLTFAALLLVYSLRFRTTLARRVLIVAGIFGVCVVLASTGGRSGVLTLVIFSFLIAHYGVRRFRGFLTVRTLVVGVLLFSFFATFPLFRRAGALERYGTDLSLIWADALDNLGELAPELSGIDRAAIMLGYFSVERIWWGASYGDLLYAPVPRTRMPDKPPVDDGVYLKTIADGSVVRPSSPARELSRTSWPMGNWTMYMNFWIPGYLVGMFLTGVGIGAAYRYMQRSEYSPFSIYLYGFIVMGGLTWSNYAIVRFLMTLGIAAPFFWVFFGRKRFLAFLRGAPPSAVPVAGLPATPASTGS